MKRQALYSCLTCIPEAKEDFTKAAGICLACCYSCHEGHELVELYTRRNFKCDCGNSKFTNKECNLNNSKSVINELNEYNHNFMGTYCTCNRPYPDPEDSIVDEMIQCITCEDWFHSRHLGVDVPSHSLFTEMTCENCVKKHSFLLHYNELSVPKSTSQDIDIENPTDNNPIETKPEVPIINEETNNTNDTIPKLDNNDLTNNISISCKKPKIKSEDVCAKFWADANWRNDLCQCPDCLKIYEEENVLFLIDPQDTVSSYEEKGKEKVRENAAKQEEDDMKFINSLDRVPLMEAIAGYNDLKSNLKEYLKKFAENKKVVREEDIREFFSTLDSKKKLKTDIPHYCR